MDPVKRSPYQPLGVSLRSFARQRIRSYVPGGDVVSRFTPPPSWAADASAPLDWRQAQQPVASPQPAAAPPDIDALVRGPAEAAPAPQAEAAQPSPAFVSQSDEVRLKAILAAHQAKRTAEAGPLVQRSTAPEDAPPNSVEQAAAGAEQPAPIQRRRRGQVIDVTPPQPTGVFDERLWDDLSPQPASRNAVELQRPAEQGPDSFSQAAADNTPTGEQTAAPSLQRSPAAAPPAYTSEAALPGRAVDAAAEAAIAGSQNVAPSLQRSPAAALPASTSEAAPLGRAVEAAAEAAIAGSQNAALNMQHSLAAAPPANTSEAALPGRAVDAAPEVVIARSQNAAPSLQRSLDVTQRSDPPSDAAGEWSAPKSAAAAPQVPSSGTAAAPPALQRSSASQFEMSSVGDTAQSASSQPPVSVPDDAFEALLAQAESVNPSPVQRAVDAPSGSSNAVSSASPDTPATAIPPVQRSAAPAGQASPAVLPPAARTAAPSAEPPGAARTTAGSAQGAPSAADAAIERAESAAPALQRTPASPTVSPSKPTPAQPVLAAAETQPIAPISAANETQPVVPPSAAAETQPIVPREAVDSALPSFRGSTETPAEMADAQTMMLQRAEAQPAVQRAPGLPSAPPSSRSAEHRTGDNTPREQAPEAQQPANDPFAALIQRAEAPPEASSSTASTARPPADVQPPSLSAVQAPVPAMQPQRQSTAPAIQRAADDAAEGQPPAVKESAAAAESLRAAEAPGPGAAVLKPAPREASQPAPPAQRASGGPPESAAVEAPKASSAPSAEASQAPTGRPTLPDAPTLLEPAAPQGLSDAIQRAIAASEVPVRPPAVEHSAESSPTDTRPSPQRLPAPDAPPSSESATSSSAVPRPAPVVLDSRLTPSPYSSFMKAPEPPASPRRPPAAPAQVQRAPAEALAPQQSPTPKPDAAPVPPSLQRAIADAESSEPAQEVDLYEALVQEGMIPPPAYQPAPTQAASRASTPSPSAQPPTSGQPPASVQRKAAAGEVVSLADGQLPPPSVVPEPGSVEAAMLDLLNLPPSTSVYGLKSGPAEPGSRTMPPSSGPQVQRVALNEALADSVRTQEPRDVQRAIEINELSASVGSPEGNGGEGQSSEPDVDDLARKVYRILKDRLRIERERSTR